MFEERERYTTIRDDFKRDLRCMLREGDGEEWYTIRPKSDERMILAGN
jgi:hypothetical protein